MDLYWLSEFLENMDLKALGCSLPLSFLIGLSFFPPEISNSIKRYVGFSLSLTSALGYYLGYNPKEPYEWINFGAMAALPSFMFYGGVALRDYFEREKTIE